MNIELEILKKIGYKESISPSELANRQADWREDKVRLAMWNLIDQGKLVLIDCKFLMLVSPNGWVAVF